MTKPVISCAKNGPFLVKGLEHFLDEKGKRLDTRPAMGLCRCGASKNRPFCDGSHKAIGFNDDKSPDRTPDQVTDYHGRHITIHNNVLLCAEAQYCHRELGSVFNENNNPWIDADGDTVERIKAVIGKCPSGALSYSTDGEPMPAMSFEPTIVVERNGPYRVSGGVELNDAEWCAGASREHYTLCRCGASRNKPFCDGSHVRIGFNDDS
jgi:CDGSH-type Zn-finger protein